MDIRLQAAWILAWKHYGLVWDGSTMDIHLQALWLGGMEALWLVMGWKHYGLVWDGSTMAWFGTKVVAGLAWQSLVSAQNGLGHLLTMKLSSAYIYIYIHAHLFWMDVQGLHNFGIKIPSLIWLHKHCIYLLHKSWEVKGRLLPQQLCRIWLLACMMVSLEKGCNCMEHESLGGTRATLEAIEDTSSCNNKNMLDENSSSQNKTQMKTKPWM